MSEVDKKGDILAEFTDVDLWPHYLSSDSEGQLLVADYNNDRILLLNNQLQLEHVLVERNSQLKLFWPKRLSYERLTSQLYVVHNSSSEGSSSNTVSQFSLRNPVLHSTQQHVTRPSLISSSALLKPDKETG